MPSASGLSEAQAATQWVASLSPRRGLRLGVLKAAAKGRPRRRGGRRRAEGGAHSVGSRLGVATPGSGPRQLGLALAAPERAQAAREVAVSATGTGSGKLSLPLPATGTSVSLGPLAAASAGVSRKLPAGPLD